MADFLNKEIKRKKSGPKVIVRYSGISVTLGSVIAKFYCTGYVEPEVSITAMAGEAPTPRLGRPLVGKSMPCAG